MSPSFCHSCAPHGDRIAEAWSRSERRGDGFAGLGGDSAYQEAHGGPAPPPSSK